VALLGSSGAGKSTLANHLRGAALATGAVRKGDHRGRHTTTHRELVLLPGGGVLIDSPGLREVGLWQGGDGVARTFPELTALLDQCRFTDCSHRREPGCGVMAALAEGKITQERLASWRKLRRELDRLPRPRRPGPAATTAHRTTPALPGVRPGPHAMEATGTMKVLDATDLVKRLLCVLYARYDGAGSWVRRGRLRGRGPGRLAAAVLVQREDLWTVLSVRHSPGRVPWSRPGPRILVVSGCPCRCWLGFCIAAAEPGFGPRQWG
jgi:energy-coupling factor transporter ATP-binding protein EcfA2